MIDLEDLDLTDSVEVSIDIDWDNVDTATRLKYRIKAYDDQGILVAKVILVDGSTSQNGCYAKVAVYDDQGTLDDEDNGNNGDLPNSGSGIMKTQ